MASLAPNYSGLPIGSASDDEKAKSIEKTLRYLASVRLYFEPMVDNIITYCNHSRRLITDKETSSKGQKTGIEVYDGTAISALNLLTDGIVGYLCSRNMRWFRFAIPGKFNFPATSIMRRWNGTRMDSYPQVRQWLQDCEEVQYSAFARSNFYDIVTEFIRDGAGPGTAHIIAEEDVGAGRISFTVPHYRECFIAENQYGRVDTNYRVYKLTLKQMAEKFGLERMKEIDSNFEQAYKDNLHADREVIHAVYPRSNWTPGREDGKGKKIESVWLQRAPLKLIEEDGYDWMPSITWRWRKNNDEWYGRSPSWDAYVDIMLANHQGKDNLEGGHRMVWPPMVAPSNLRGQINVGPKGWTYMDGDLNTMAPRPLVTGIQLPYTVDAQERTKQIIRDHYAVDFFLALTMAAQQKIELTATQVMEMAGEKAAVLGTRVGMLQSEALDPIHDRVFEIEYRSGRMPTPPPVLQEAYGGMVEIEYMGPLAQAQLRLSKERSIQAGITLVSQIAQVNPTCLDMIDWDGAIEDALDSTGFPSNRIRTPEQVTAIRQQRLQAQERDKKIETMTPMAKLLRAAGPKPEPGSPAQKLMSPEETEQKGAEQ
jgi:hypothetical protein